LHGKVYLKNHAQNAGQVEQAGENAQSGLCQKKIIFLEKKYL
jgi:hypothetical protein